MAREEKDTTRRNVIRSIAGGAALGLGAVGAASGNPSVPETISKADLIARDDVERLDETASEDCDRFAQCTVQTCDYGYDGYPMNLRYIYECCDDGCEIVDSTCDCPAHVP